MKTIMSLCISVVFSSYVFSVSDLTYEENIAAALRLSVPALGRDEGTSITNGFLFVDGRYIPPPYHVTRSGNLILINDIYIDKSGMWPPPKRREKKAIKELPSMPKTSTKYQTSSDKDVVDYIVKMKSYLEYTYGQDEMVKRMVGVFKSLPGVIDAKQENPFSVTVTWKNQDGTETEIISTLVSRERGQVEWTREKVIEWASESKSRYERGLGFNDYYFLSPKGFHSRLTGTEEGALKLLIHLIPILEVSENGQEVFERMQTLKFIVFDKEMATAFFSNRDSITPELKQRVEALRSEQEKRKSRHRKNLENTSSQRESQKTR